MANTTNQGWSKPTVGGSEDTWGATINTTLDAIDTLVGPVTAAEIAKLDGLTSSTAELNKLTGVTSTPAELNLVAGLTASTAELNHVTGVTSAIQTQINTLTSGKQSVDATLTALAGLATGANKVPYSTGTDTFSQLDFKDEDNMASDSATAVPSQQSVKAYVDAITSIGVGQTWQTPTRSIATTYQNTTGKPIQVSIGTSAQNTLGLKAGATSGGMVQIASCAYYSGMQCIIPDQWYYQAYNINGAGVAYWNELR